MSVAVAAEKLGVGADDITAWESGTRQPTVAQFRKAAKLYKRPSAALLLDDVPKDFTIRHDYRRVHGKAPAASSALTFAIRKARLLQETSIDLASALGEQPKPSLPTASLDDDVVSLAKRVREALGITLEAQFRWPKDEYTPLGQWRGAVEALGVLVVQFSGVDVDEARGFSIWSDDWPLVAINTKDSPRARVFSVLHELGHLALRAEGLCDFREADGQTERFCNALAAEVLVPRTALLAEAAVRAAGARHPWSDDELSDLSRRYGVSREVMLLRLVNVGKATRAHYALMRKGWDDAPRPKQEGAPPRERLALAHLGEPYVRLVLDAFYEKRITARDVADCFDLKVEFIPKVEALVLGGARR